MLYEVITLALIFVAHLTGLDVPGHFLGGDGRGETKGLAGKEYNGGRDNTYLP